MSYKSLDISIENHIAHVKLNRPDALNSMNVDFWKEFPIAIREIDASAEARVIVLSSTGKHFSAGMDLSVFTTSNSIPMQGDPSRMAENLRRAVLELQDAFNCLEDVRIPVLTAIQGGCIGGAVDLKLDKTGFKEDYFKVSLEDGFESNNGPPLIKITWIDGNLWVYKKSLVNENASGYNLLDVSSNTWTDEKHNMGTVGFNEFEFSIKASKGKIELQLNNEIPYIYEDISLAKWPFQNYYKAGNYLNTTDSGAFSKLKYYSLSVSH